MDNKKAMAMSMILNLVIAVIAISFSVGLVLGADDDCGPTGCDESETETIPTPPPSGEGFIPTEPEGGGEEGEDDEDPETGEGIRPPGIDGTGTPGTGTPGTGTPPGGGGIGNWFSGIAIQSMIQYGTVGAGLFSAIGSMAGGDDGPAWGALAGAVGGAVTGLLTPHFRDKPIIPVLAGLGIATMIFLLTYKKSTEEIVEFHCLPWQAPIGGENCEVCNDYEHCSEYSCKSLGQACEIINAGTVEQKCVWVNPHDVSSPRIELTEVSKEHIFKPDKTIRPPATGVVVSKDDGDCIRPYFPLEFMFETNEPAQCKVDYNLIAGTKEDPRAAYDKMEFFVGGDQLYQYNHTERLSLPGPDAINAIAPELKNDGEYTLFVRCQDANGNFNQDAYSVSFCVDKAPDATAPLIVNTNVPSGNPVQFNQTNLDLEVYVNEPVDCRWSFEDRDYDNMESEMKCKNNVWEMNNELVYTCKTKLTGIRDRAENNYYFKCKDQPYGAEGDRNENKQSYKYTVIGTQPLNILNVNPNRTIRDSTDTVPVYLEIKTDNGYKNGEALCYYYNDGDNAMPANEEDYVLFHETNGSSSNVHRQRQDLVQGSYAYYFKCVDLGGNAAYTSTNFNVEIDRVSPVVVRVYKDSELKIITNEEAECSYSNSDCNFEIGSGVRMDSVDDEIHTAEWVLNNNYYIRCEDGYGNQPDPNRCSIIVRPSRIDVFDAEEEDDWTLQF